MKSTNSRDILRQHVDVAILADKYDVNNLKDCAIARLKEYLQSDAETHPDIPVKRNILQSEYTEELFDMLEHIYTNTVPTSDKILMHNGLRVLAVELHWRSGTLVTHRTAWGKLLSGAPEFAADLADHKSRSFAAWEEYYHDGVTYECRKHDTTVKTSVRSGGQCGAIHYSGWSEDCEMALVSPHPPRHAVSEEEDDVTSDWDDA